MSGAASLLTGRRPGDAVNPQAPSAGRAMT